MSRRVACANGWMMPAAAPWTRRNWINAGGDGAEQRGDDKESNGAGEGLPRSKAPTEPSGQRGHHGGGAEIARHDPGAEIEPATQTLFELRQSDVCDRAVEGLHRGGDHPR